MVMSRRTLRTVAAVTALALLAPGVRADDAGVSLQSIRIPDGGIHPQAQLDTRGRLHLIYFKGDPKRGDIFYVRCDDGGAKFTSPIRVNSHPDSAVIMGTVRGPHLAIGKNDRPHVAWMGSDKAEPKGEGRSVPMLYTRLNEAGDGFELQRNVVQTKPGLDGGGSVAADREGNVYVAWHAPGAHHSGGAHGSQQHEPGHDEKHAPQKHQRPAGHGGDEEDRQVWITRSHDDGKTFDTETAAIPKKTGSCACCGMNMAAADGGRVFITFRSATEKVNRDIHVLASKDFGKTFEIATVDPWRVGTCVMSTAAFAVRGDDVLGAWETMNQIRVAALDGKASEERTLSMPGEAKSRKHPAVAMNSRGEYAVAWAEGTGWNKGGAIVWQVFDSKGQPIADRAGRLDGMPAWSIPAVVADENGTFKIIH